MKTAYLSQIIKLYVLGGALLTVVSPLNASDLQIYAGPGTGGQKTLIMMLDRSGSMGMIADDYNNNAIVADFDEFRNADGSANYSLCSATGADGKKKFLQNTREDIIFPEISYTRNYCQVTGGEKRYDRLSRLKDGMFEMLNSTDSKLENVYIGLGYYSNNDHISGVIKVPARRLGKVNSDHRKLLKEEIANITAGYSTPTAHAYAEAAAYLLGTNTSGSHSQVPKYNYVETAVNRDNQNEFWHSYCENGTIDNCVGSWTGFRKEPFNLSGYVEKSSYFSSPYTYTTYTKRTTGTLGLSDSGFNSSTSTSKEGENYKSPLPLNGATCDGQGVYILSDGQPNNTSDSRAQFIASKALKDDTFSCDITDNISNSSTDSGWKCMGAFSRKLYSGNHIKQRPIQTAFVGFGKEFEGDMSASLSVGTRNACRLGSAAVGDACSYWSVKTAQEEVANPETVFRNSEVGFGNGGFFQAKTPEDVTQSVLRAIGNLDKGTIEPLTTGAWSVPVDDLNPTGVQPFGYVRTFKPNPGSEDVLWAGNLKKYHVVDGVLRTSDTEDGTNIFNVKGEFNLSVRDIWGKSSGEGGDVYRGGAYANINMPTINNPTNIRNLYTNYAVKDDILSSDLADKASLLKIPAGIKSDERTIAYIANQFNENAVISKFSNQLKRKLLNFLGYNVEINDAAVPNAEQLAQTLLETEWNSFGGISHSMPVQVTYSGTLDANGELQSDRNQSVLFGTMDGALRLVTAHDGIEQFAFIPSDILEDSWQSLALRKTSTHANGPAHGTDASWVVDPVYNFEETTDSENKPITKVKAEKVSIYGGLRMGGNSYYGLDISNPSSPKFKFRVSSTQSAYSAMGQSWSKPVLANMRIGGKFKRVMVVGGGYDVCYEDPRFKLNTDYSADLTKSSTFRNHCSNKTKAKGNAVYIIDAETGERLLWVSNVGANLNNTHMVHSIVSDISTVDTDGDNLVDHLYFGDLGGQVFRVDLNNLNNSAASQNFGVRVVRIANLATFPDTGLAVTNGDNPRFYEAPTLSMHRESNKKFLLVGIASGDRSSPLDVAPIGRDRPETLSAALTDRPTNNVYGIIDIDALKSDINTNYSSTLTLDSITMKQMLKDPQVVAKTSGVAVMRSNLYPYATAATTLVHYGWYRSLSSNADGVERSATGVFRKAGGIKAFEAPVVIKNTLTLSTYDPESSTLGEQDPCQVRVIGESFRQYYCLPFGVCLTQSGSIDSFAETRTGWRPAREQDKQGNEVVADALGKGILGNALVDKESSQGNCGGLQLGGNISGTGEWACISQTKPMNWYAK